MSNISMKWAATPEGAATMKQLRDDDSLNETQAVNIANQKVAEYQEKQQELNGNMDPAQMLGIASKSALGKGATPQMMNALNNSIEEFGIYNEVSENIKQKKAKLKPPKGSKVVDVPVDISKSWSYLADDLNKYYDYDAEADWDVPLMKHFNEVEGYKKEIGDMTESNKKDFVYNFIESDFYQKHLQQFMTDNPGMNYKYADYVMSNMFTKLLLVGAKGVMKPASFDDFGSPKSWKIDRFSIPMMSSEYMKMVDEFGESVNKGKDTSRDIKAFEDKIVGE